MTVLRYEAADPRSGVPVRRALVLAAAGARARFGRAPDCEVVLASDRVGRRHCEVVRVTDGDHAVVKDAGSVNGTRVDDHPVRGQARLRPGAALVMADAPALTVSAPASAPDDPLAGWPVAAVDRLLARLSALEDEEERGIQRRPLGLSRWLRAASEAGLGGRSARLGEVLDQAEHEPSAVALLRRIGDLRDASVAARLAALGESPLRHLVEALYAFGRVEHRLGVGQTWSQIPFPGGVRLVDTGMERWELDSGAVALTSMLAPGGPQAGVTTPDGTSASLDASHPTFDLISGGAVPAWSAAADGLFALAESGVVALILCGPSGERVTADLRGGHWVLAFRPGPGRRRGSSASSRSVSARLLLIQSDPPGVDDVPLAARVVKIGRGPDSAVKLRDPSASRNHAELRRKGRAWTVVDCATANGTRVNGKRIKSCPLQSGDRLQFGEVVAYFIAPPARSTGPRGLGRGSDS